MARTKNKRTSFVGSEKTRVASFLKTLKREAENAVASFRAKLDVDPSDNYARGSIAHWQSVVGTLNWIIERSQETWKEWVEETD